jgi:excisionase family DNA binding protein
MKNMRTDWLSLSAAAELLGVHPSTVRSWSDKGLLPVYRTKGGHRRFKRHEVVLWSKSARTLHPVEPEDMVQSAVRNVRMQISEGRLEAELWYQKLDEDARLQYRRSAHTLFQGLMNFLVSNNEEAASEADAIGYEYASRARRYNLDYTDATRAYLFFRTVLIESVMKVYSAANVPPGQAWEDMLRRIISFTDRILLTLLETFLALEKNTNG